jgi:hypothetical protein
MRRLLAPALLCAGTLVSAACVDPMDEVWQLTEFRVLAVKADPPEPARGDEFTLTLVSADPRERELQVAWILCGAAGCAPVTDPSSPFPFPDLRPQVTARAPATGGTTDGSGREVLTLLAFACAGGTIGLPADGGTTPTCNGEGARGWQFSRTIPVHGPMASMLNPTPNANPQIAEVRFGREGALMAIEADAPPTVPRCTDRSIQSTCPRYRFEVGFVDGSREEYQSLDPVTRMPEVRTERLTTGYVIEAGTLAGGFRTDSTVEPTSRMDNNWIAPERPGTYRLFLYATDNRGGFDATLRSVRVE